MDEEDKTRLDMLWDKLDSRLDKSGDCWIWTGFVEENGYGRIYLDVYPGDPTKEFVHRLMYLMKIGHIPEGMVVTQKCGNKLCCKPKHLLLATRSDISANGNKTHCIRGHKLPIPKQVGVREIRVCRECNSIRQAEYRKSKQESQRKDHG